MAMGPAYLQWNVKSVLVIAALTLTSVQSLMIPINNELKRDILTKHNDLRRQVMASYMMELGWDETLARKAEQFASSCRYERPSSQEYDAGFNMGIRRRHILERDSEMIKELVNSTVDGWARSRENYVYGSHCGQGCNYAQMIQAESENIGCAVENCDNRMHRYERWIPEKFTLIVCFYSPWKSLTSNAPYQRSAVNYCTRCPRNRVCLDNLCALRDKRPQGLPLVRNPVYDLSDELDSSEIWTLTNAHNALRRSGGLEELVWDSGYLLKWAKYILHCTINYPGPRGTYTNFHRLRQGESISSVVSTWSRERGLDFSQIRASSGCRTKNDEGTCNHYQNLMRDDTDAMACEAKFCSDSRQLVCLYAANSVRTWEQRSYFPITRSPRPITRAPRPITRAPFTRAPRPFTPASYLRTTRSYFRFQTQGDRRTPSPRGRLNTKTGPSWYQRT
ncbi:cysteine-rich venom protein VAR4 [Biomphalaria pfeifferi]|uniref:Cysteine-rich venom protein VAR4 n=1 Tax=Biomphalaria pfeifferi TaxID=112525 RepID=A0AAD8BC30_BIOPF|nr:cysteine-rich venom protein VAR4 [Biomphalaria pfeifferi]